MSSCRRGAQRSASSCSAPDELLGRERAAELGEQRRQPGVAELDAVAAGLPEAVGGGDQHVPGQQLGLALDVAAVLEHGEREPARLERGRRAVRAQQLRRRVAGVAPAQPAALDDRQERGHEQVLGQPPAQDRVRLGEHLGGVGAVERPRLDEEPHHRRGRRHLQPLAAHVADQQPERAAGQRPDAEHVAAAGLLPGGLVDEARPRGPRAAAGAAGRSRRSSRARPAARARSRAHWRSRRRRRARTRTAGPGRRARTPPRRPSPRGPRRPAGRARSARAPRGRPAPARPSAPPDSPRPSRAPAPRAPRRGPPSAGPPRAPR